MVRTRAGLVAFAASAAFGTMGAWAAGRALAPPPAEHRAQVVEVVDGDTIVVQFAGGARDTVRILGVDTPETKKPHTPVQCFGPEASAYTHARLDGREVTLELDREPRDRYGRLLAYVWIDGALYDDELLRLGYARLLLIAPNDLHARRLVHTALDARTAGRGVWSAC